MSSKKNKLFQWICGAVLLSASCQKDYNFVVPPVPVKSYPHGIQTPTLEAWYASTSPNTLNAAFWKSNNYITISAKDLSKQLLYSDGLLNMSGTYNGIADFNKGNDPKITLRAAFDTSNLYILAEWYDSTVNLSQSSWLYNGDKDPLKPSESFGGWTSQRNSDKFALAFEINSASSNGVGFASGGCVACCHSAGSSTVMSPTSGTVDIWNWSLATSGPLGYAHDMVAGPSGLTPDAGQTISTRNISGTSDRSGPAYEWDGTPQQVTLPSGSVSILQPTFYLLNKTPMIGDAINGENLFHGAGNCSDCHGDQGRAGGGNTGMKILKGNISQNLLSRQEYKNIMNSVHTTNDWSTLSESMKDDIVAYLRGLAGTPGYYLNTPVGSSADVKVLSNVSVAQISNALIDSTNKHTTKYQVLFIRKLITNNSDDIQFNPIPENTYSFGIAVMNNDGRNHIGSFKETLTFKK